MASKSPNMKVNVTADNSDLNRKMKEAKASVKDFENVSSAALDKVGEAFGVPVQKIEQMGSALRGLGNKMQESGNAGAQAFGKLLSCVNGLTAGLAGIGIAGVVASFKLLNDEATAFKNTMAGANIDVMTTSYIDTYRQVLHDFNAETGRSVAEAEASWKKAWAEFTANLRYTIVSGSVGAGQSVLGGIFTMLGGGKSDAAAQANEAATEAERIAGRIFEIQRKISDKTVEWARLERDIAEQKRIAYDKTESTATQQAAILKAEELIKERFKDEAILRGQLADLQVQYNSLAESSIADIDKANQLRVQEESVVAALNNALRELSERQATIALNAEKEAQARADALASAQAIAKSRADLAVWGQMAQGVANPIEGVGAEAISVPGIAVPVTPELDMSTVIDLTNELQSIMTSSFESIGSSLGGLIGDLATGGDAWGNFANAAISAFGDMAISVGKMAISTGTATLGIKAALESLNGWVAIAAGTALVALGTAVKSGLSNIASGGGYSATSSVASSTGSYGSSSLSTGYETREVTVNVVGTLRGEGNQLLAVIENENTRKNHTT